MVETTRAKNYEVSEDARNRALIATAKSNIRDKRRTHRKPEATYMRSEKSRTSGGRKFMEEPSDEDAPDPTAASSGQNGAPAPATPKAAPKMKISKLAYVPKEQLSPRRDKRQRRKRPARQGKSKAWRL